MIVSLPMYDLAEVRDATAAWWSAIARHSGLAMLEKELDRSTPLVAMWTSPGLLFSQTCGYPLTHLLAARVRYMATPSYAATGCDGPYYRSAILVRQEAPPQIFADARGMRVAINGHDSQSGCNVLRAMAAETGPERPFFGSVRVTGAHVASIEAIREGTADLAAIDCVTLALLRKYRPSVLLGLRVLCWSPSAPALPYITSLDQPDPVHAALLRGLRAAATDPKMASVRSALLIEGVAILPPTAYTVIPGMRRRAEAMGLVELSPLAEHSST